MYNTSKGLDVSHRIPFPPNKKYYKHQWVGGGLLRCFRYGLGWVPGGFPVGSRGLRVGSSCSAMQVPAGFPVGSRWLRVGSSRSLSGFEVGSGWVSCCAMWFGVLGWAPRWGGCKLPPYPPKEKRRNNIEWERGAQEIACLGRPKACCAHRNTHREETGSYHLASLGHHGNPSLRKARCHLLPSSKTGSCG